MATTTAFSEPTAQCSATQTETASAESEEFQEVVGNKGPNNDNLPNAGNGGAGPNYKWTQTLKEVVLTMDMPIGKSTNPLKQRVKTITNVVILILCILSKCGIGTRAKHIVVEVTGHSIKVMMIMIS